MLERDSEVKRPSKDESFSRKHTQIDGAAEAERPVSLSKRPLNTPQPTRSLSGLQAMNLGEKNEESRAAVSDGISADSSSREASGSPPPRRSKAQPLQSPMDTDSRRQTTTSRRPKGKLWTPDQDSLFTRSSFDPSNIASIQANKTRAQAMKPGAHRSIKSSPQLMPRSAPHLNHESKPQGEDYTIILQPETRPISQVQLVAEVKGIYADLVMVEAKCIEVDNKQAGLTQGDSSQPKLNNEQWQVLIALYCTLLHEHHDLFLASQHSLASLALCRFTSKYTIPNYILVFIYLAYLMIALLYETILMFEDTWIEYPGDLTQYRIVIEDNNTRD
ncbi:hypothetical protein BPOR_1336g00020 [Botrytis porri]|uniref:Uncharacterized protein n=1 Tax=Botrytis porri TaxID=87229 RepID=A0A4Z1K6J4_9HELO|nr:hypothetical protein BPOR_1336g00020 [Botrytis porri]